MPKGINHVTKNYIKKTYLHYKMPEGVLLLLTTFFI